MTQVLFNLRTAAQSYVSRGLQMASFERQVRRTLGSTEGLNLRNLFREAQAVRDNQEHITGSGGNLRPRAGRDMIPEASKKPFNYRYVMQVDLVDPAGNKISEIISVYEDDALLSKGEVERRTKAKADTEVGRKYWLNVDPESQVVGVTMLNAYWNINE